MKKVFLLTLMCFFALFASAQWIESLQKFKSTKYNIQWDLSEFGTWRVMNTNELPPNYLFAAANDEIGVVVLIIAFDNNKPVGDIWEGSSAFIDGFIKSGIDMFAQFPGMKREEPTFEKCYLLYKKALRIKQPILISDARKGSDEFLSQLFYGYAFAKGNSIILINTLIPSYIYEELDEDVANEIISKLSYIRIDQEK